MTQTGSSDALLIAFVDHIAENGGAELALRRVLENGEHVALIAPAAQSDSTDAFANLPDGIRTDRTGPQHVGRSADSGLLSPLRLAVTLMRSTSSLRRSPVWRDADVVVANTTRSSVYVALASLIGRRRKPYVVHLRDIIEPEALGSVAVALMRKLVLPHAAAVVANSHASLRAVQSYLRPGTPTLVCASPAGLKVGSAKVLRSGLSRVGMVARIDPWKGQHLLLRAFAEAFATGETTLVFAGGPAFGHAEYLRELRILAGELGIAERVVFLGHVDDVPEVIDSLDVCVQASTRPEPLGQNVLQYLSAGRVVIVSGEGGPVEWVRTGENGLTFTPRDHVDLARRLKEVADDSALRERLAQAAATTPGLMSDADVAQTILGFVSQAGAAT